MRIPASRVLDRVQPGASVILRGVGGRPKGQISSRELAELVAIEAIEGVGSPTRLKYVQMVIEEGEMVTRKAKLAREIRAGRTHSALENLMRMVSDRKTVFRRRAYRKDEHGIRLYTGLCYWEHKTPGWRGAHA